FQHAPALDRHEALKQLPSRLPRPFAGQEEAFELHAVITDVDLVCLRSGRRLPRAMGQRQLAAGVRRKGRERRRHAPAVSVDEPQSLGIAGASGVVKRRGTASSQAARSNSQGEAEFVAPFGPYTVSVSAEGVGRADREIDVISNTVTSVQVRLELAGLAQSVS